MSSLDRLLDGQALVLDLAHEHAQMTALLPDKHGRTARTILKSGALRLTLISLAPGGALPDHAASGPIFARGRARSDVLAIVRYQQPDY